jgi:hypothetical protein
VWAAVAVAYRRAKNFLEVTDLLFPRGAGRQVVREVVLFALTDAYRCSGACEVRFRSPTDADGSARLAEVRALAEAHGVPLREWHAGHIDADAGRALYLALSGMSAEACAVANELEAAGRGRAESICYLIHTGTWTGAEAESLLRTCPYPDAVFAGGCPPADRHLGRLAADHARAAVLAGRLERFLRMGPVPLDTPALATHSAIECRIRPTGVWEYTWGDDRPPVLDGWRRSAAGPMGGSSLTVVGVPADRADLPAVWDQSLAAARASGPTVAVLAPADFDQLNPTSRAALQDAAARGGVNVLAAPDSFAQLTLEVRRRLAFARTIRR